MVSIVLHAILRLFLPPDNYNYILSNHDRQGFFFFSGPFITPQAMILHGPIRRRYPRRSLLIRPELELVLGREKFLENYFPDDSCLKSQILLSKYLFKVARYYLAQSGFEPGLSR